MNPSSNKITVSPHPPEETLLGYAMGRLSNEQKYELESHLLVCSECLETVKDHLRAQIAFAKLYKPISSPSDWKEQLLARIAQPLESHWPPQLTKRLRVLLHTTPLLQLRAWDTLRQPETRTTTLLP
jgi:anti-sigma factor ChrR (cupin superfamily)